MTVLSAGGRAGRAGREREVGMSTRRQLGLIAFGYLLAAGAGVAAVSIRYWFADPADVAASSGMYAAGDMMMFLLVAGGLALVPTAWLLWLTTRAWPRVVAAGLFVLSLTGPLAWWVMSSPDNLRGATWPMLGLLVAFVVFPRVIVSPVACLVLFVALALAREMRTRALLAAALLIEATPVLMFAWHMARSIRA